MKYGIVGKNGVGKTTLLRLLLQDLMPDSGTIQRFCNIIDLPQSHMLIDKQATIADALGISEILFALEQINTGCMDENNFAIVADHWDIEKRTQDALSTFNLYSINLNRLFHQLSGGQKTKVLLSKTLIFPDYFVIFDEPTNNLDAESRYRLYQYIANSSQGMIIVSHDRTLLNLCSQIIEITTKGIHQYGGNYDFYHEQKKIKSRAIQQAIQSRADILIKAKHNIQTRMERHQKNESRGYKVKAAQIKAKGSYDKIQLKSMQGRSEKTNRRIRLQSDRMLEQVNAELLSARALLEVDKNLNISLTKTKVPNNKTVINIENIFFSYDNQYDIIKDFNLHMSGSDRIAITGPNGCGKTTLIKLIRGILLPGSGEITIGVNSIAYLDQAVSFLKPSLSIIENFLNINPKANPFEAYSVQAGVFYELASSTNN